MDQEDRENTQWVAGATDGVALLARAFSFPDEDLVRALCDGRFVEDAASCASDLGVFAAVEGTLDKLRTLVDGDPEMLLSKMRQAFSRLYLVPGEHRTLYPYEGAFRFAADGRSGMPSVFANRAAVAVGKLMRAEGLEPDPERHEPADSIWFELAYLSFLYGQWWQALEVDAADDVRVEYVRGKIDSFQRDHGRPWMVSFMEQSQCQGDEVYGTLARLGAVVLGCVLNADEN